MSSEQQANDQPSRGRPAWLQVVIAHPYITGFNLLLMIMGILVAVTQLPGEWSLLRRVVAGGMSGISIGLIITANRMLGAWR